MMERFLVTGGSGFLGAEVLADLARRGIETHVISRNLPRQAEQRGAAWHRLNVLSDSPLNLLATIRPTHCLHLAWETTPGSYRDAPENYDWVAATTRLARAFYELGGRQFTMAGTCAEYVSSAEPCHETNTPVAGDCAYAICKIETSRLLAGIARDCGGNFSAGRLFYVYGQGEPQKKLIRTICQGLQRGAPVALTSGLDCRDFIHVSDAASALVELSVSKLDGAVNIGTGRGVLVRELAARLGEISGKPELLQFGKLALGRQPVQIVADARRVNSELGFHPSIDLEHGLRGCFDYWTAREQQTLEVS
jgi:nucleoside-diphosphate-sugar epimerase